MVKNWCKYSNDVDRNPPKASELLLANMLAIGSCHAASRFNERLEKRTHFCKHHANIWYMFDPATDIWSEDFYHPPNTTRLQPKYNKFQAYKKLEAQKKVQDYFPIMISRQLPHQESWCFNLLLISRHRSFPSDFNPVVLHQTSLPLLLLNFSDKAHGPHHVAYVHPPSIQHASHQLITQLHVCTCSFCKTARDGISRIHEQQDEQLLLNKLNNVGTLIHAPQLPIQPIQPPPQQLQEQKQQQPLQDAPMVNHLKRIAPIDDASHVCSSSPAAVADSSLLHADVPAVVSANMFLVLEPSLSRSRSRSHRNSSVMRTSVSAARRASLSHSDSHGGTAHGMGMGMGVGGGIIPLQPAEPHFEDALALEHSDLCNQPEPMEVDPEPVAPPTKRIAPSYEHAKQSFDPTAAMDDCEPVMPPTKKIAIAYEQPKQSIDLSLLSDQPVESEAEDIMPPPKKIAMAYEQPKQSIDPSQLSDEPVIAAVTKQAPMFTDDQGKQSIDHTDPSNQPEPMESEAEPDVAPPKKIAPVSEQPKQSIDPSQQEPAISTPTHTENPSPTVVSHHTISPSPSHQSHTHAHEQQQQPAVVQPTPVPAPPKKTLFQRIQALLCCRSE